MSYSVTVKHHTHSSAVKLTIRTNVVTCVTVWWCLLICCLNSRKICPLRCHSAWLVICMTRKPHDRKCLTAWKSRCVEICVCLGFSEDTAHFHCYFNTFIAEKIIIHFKGALSNVFLIIKYSKVTVLKPRMGQSHISLLEKLFHIALRGAPLYI